MMLNRLIYPCVCVLLAWSAHAGGIDDLPVFKGRVAEPVTDDYLITTLDRESKVYRSEDGRDLIMDNGLVRRVWRLTPNAACYRFDNLMTGQAMLRAVRPEAVVTIDGVQHEVGGLVGQPNHAFLLPEWLDEMQATPGGMVFTGFEVSDEITPRLPWTQNRHHDPNVVWPPKGVHLRMDYRLSNEAVAEDRVSQVNRRLYESNMTERDNGWRVYESKSHPRSSFENEGKFGEIYTPHNSVVFADRDLPKGVEVVEAKILLGTDQSASWGPGIGLVWGKDNDERVAKFTVRTGDSQFGFSNGQGERNVAGRHDSPSYRLRMIIGEKDATCYARAEGKPWERIGKIDFPQGVNGKPGALRVGKMSLTGGRDDHDSANAQADLGRCKIDEVIVYGQVDPRLERQLERAQQQAAEKVDPIIVSVHYELYDGIPVMNKWITVQNNTDREITVDRFTAEVLSVVEEASWVASPSRQNSDSKTSPVVYPTPSVLEVKTDYSFGSGENADMANAHVVHWETDRQFTSQVNYSLQTPCLLVVRPEYGPAQTLAAGETFTSFRVFQLVHDSTERERRGLATRRMYRTLAPWVTENPITHHLQNSNPQVVRRAVDQAKEVGFEMVIMSFGSGYNVENEDPAYIQQWKELRDYAKSQGIDLGGYSLLASRSVGGGNDVVSPPGKRPAFGRSPCLCSKWGQDYFRKLYNFHEKTGMSMFEHDGNYPGDLCAAIHHPGHKGLEDSRWNQWKVITDFYRYCREKGIYLNVPDRYFLNGSSKCGMGYREVNWSLPRAHQVIHTRQNIYDGTWDFTPSMGWMFVPLVQYQGGGPAATVEPLDTHLDHYERMMLSNFGLGVQAHYRGPRLYDTERTKNMVKRTVAWYKKYRDILDSDLIHGRRADGQDIDWMLHVNPYLEQKGMLVVYNPLKKEVTKKIRVNLYYTGLTESATFSHEDKTKKTYQIPRNDIVEVEVTVPAEGMTWYVIR